MGIKAELSEDYTGNFVKELCQYWSGWPPEIDDSLIPADTGKYIEGPFDFTNLTLGEAIKRISDFDGYSFYVDKDSKLHYFLPSSPTVIEVSTTDIIDYTPFLTSDYELYNYIIVNYEGEQSTVASSQSSIETYGKYIKIINNTSITSETDALTLAESYLERYSEPVLSGKVTIEGDTNVTLEDGLKLDVSELEISGTYDIIGYTHKLNKDGFYTSIDYGMRQFNPMTDLAAVQSNVDMLSESMNTSPPGSDGYIIYNADGLWGACSNFTVDSDGNTTIDGQLEVNSDVDFDNILTVGDRLIISDAKYNMLIGDNGKDDVNDRGNYNIQIGYQANNANIQSRNIIIGHQAGYKNTGGEKNVFIGYKSGYDGVLGSSNIFIGHQSGYSETTSNKLYITNYETAYPLIWGDLKLGVLKFGNNSSNWGAELNAGSLLCTAYISTQCVSSQRGIFKNKIILNGTTTQPTKIAGTFWSSGSTTYSRLYYCSANNGSWKEVNLV